MKEKTAVFSFFAGAGFLDLGFELTGFYKTVYVNEYSKAFNYIYRYAREKMEVPIPDYGYNVCDVRDLLEKIEIEKLEAHVCTAREKYGLVGFIGGPPCPDFSVAGKNKGKEGENGQLSETYANLICEIQPDFFLFENVKGLYRTTKHRQFFDHLKCKFKDSGYCLDEQLINALEFGTPQDRERIILIGFHKKAIRKLNIKVTDACLLDFPWDKNKIYTRKQIESQIWPRINAYKENGDLQMPDNLLENLTVQYWWNKNNVEHHPNSNMSFKPRAGLIRFQTIDEGDDKKKCFKRLHRWRYSPTAAYGNNEVHIHPYKSRRISVSEALAIQSLPKEFELPGDISLTDAFKAIGNGVPYLAASGIAKDIYDYITNSRK